MFEKPPTLWCGEDEVVLQRSLKATSSKGLLLSVPRFSGDPAWDSLERAAPGGKSHPARPNMKAIKAIRTALTRNSSASEDTMNRRVGEKVR